MDLPNPGIEPWSPALLVDSLSTELSEKPYYFDKWEKMIHIYILHCVKEMSSIVFSCDIICLKDHSVNRKVIGSFR